MKKYILAGTFALALASCSDSFLEEKMVSSITQDYLNTEIGLDQLIVSSYNSVRFPLLYTEGLHMLETGHDCAMKSGATSLNKFAISEWSPSGLIGNQANQFMGFQSKQQAGFLINGYPIIDNCNKAITAIRSGDALGKYASDPSFAAARLSEVLFNRAYVYYLLNTVFGDVYFSTESSTSLPSNYQYTRTPASVMFKELIGDLRYAVEHLPEQYSEAEYGRATKYAAAHLLAKIYLNRYQGKEYGTPEYGRRADGTIDNSNEKSYLGMLYKGEGAADLDSCIYYANMVINAHPLVDDYHELFRHDLGDFSNEKTTENVLNAVFSESGDNYRYGVRALTFFVGDYAGDKYGIPSRLWEYGGKSNQGFCNDDFGIDVFTDKLNDSRYQKTFRLEYVTGINTSGASTPSANGDYYAYNDERNKTYVWNEEQAAYFNEHILPTYNRPSWGGRKAVAGEHKMGTGDISRAMIENTKETAIDVEVINAQPYPVFARWVKDGNKYYYRPQIVGNDDYSFADSKIFYGLENTSKTGKVTNMKYDDPNRGALDSESGGRDIPVMRSAEMYLVRAEACGRKGEYGKAIEDINVLRRRAAFKPGETRNEVLARLYPGHENLSNESQQWPYEVDNNSYDAIKVDASYWDGTSEKSKLENYTPVADTPEKRFLEFIYNEYAREFNEEFIYYGVIHHAGVQAQRIQWHNQMGANSANNTYPVGSWDVSDNVNGGNGQTGNAKGNFQNYMTLKPFSRTFIELLTDENGVLLDEAAKKAYQNYGY